MYISIYYVNRFFLSSNVQMCDVHGFNHQEKIKMACVLFFCICDGTIYVLDVTLLSYVFLILKEDNYYTTICHLTRVAIPAKFF